MKVSKLIVPIVVLTATYNSQVEAGHCEDLYRGFSNTCRGFSSPVQRAICWPVAASAYAACLAGRSFGGGGFGFNV